MRTPTKKNLHQKNKNHIATPAPEMNAAIDPQPERKRERTRGVISMDVKLTGRMNKHLNQITDRTKPTIPRATFRSLGRGSAAPRFYAEVRATRYHTPLDQRKLERHEQRKGITENLASPRMARQWAPITHDALEQLQRATENRLMLYVSAAQRVAQSNKRQIVFPKDFTQDQPPV